MGRVLRRWLAAFVVAAAVQSFGFAEGAVTSVSVDLRLSLPANGRAYEVGEPISFVVTAMNVGVKPVNVQVPPEMVLPDELLIRDSEGKRLPYTGALMISRSSVSGPLSPGESISGEGIVNRWVVLSAPGKYTVQVGCELGTGGFARFTSVYSPEVSFVVERAAESNRERRFAEARSLLASARTAEERKRAVLTLGLTLDTRAIPLLVERMRESGLNGFAEERLRAFPEQGAVREALVRELRVYGPYESLGYMLSWMRVPEKESVPLLGEWLRKGSAPQRASALHSLWMNSSGYVDLSLKPLILKALEDTNPDVRLNAVLALGGGRYGKDTLGAVRRVAENDPDDHVRGQAKIAVGWYGEK